MGRILHRRRRFPQNLPVGRGGILDVGTAGGEQFVGELVVRFVASDRVLDPLPQRNRSGLSQKLAVDLQQISPLVGPVFDVLGTSYQLIDHLVAFGLRFARIAQKGPYLVCCGGQTGQIQVDPPDEVFVAAEVTGQES